MSLLSVSDLSITYRAEHGEVEAVSGINFDVVPGEMTAIVGESGSGKSTSAMAAIGLLAENATIVSGS
ncbi:ATP-binding cassette domain-containing protein, partial [Corynebacterium sp.]|uniref:ATP-binding cassette domain-containing protein n=1 Tax=Corynebacterium sp. TaxID=1720 RepID=UPI0027BA8D63